MTKNSSCNSDKKNLFFVDIQLFVMSLAWGINFSVVKIALTFFSPLSFNSLRFGLASLLLLILLCILKRSFFLRKEDLSRLVLIALIGHTTHQLFFIFGISRTTAGNSSLILATTPIFVSILSLISGLEKVKRRVWLSATLSLVGILLIVQGAEGMSLKNHDLVGDLLILASTISWSAYTVLSKPLLRLYSPFELTTITMVIGTIPIIVVSIPSLQEQNWGSVSAYGWLSLSASFLIVVIGYLIWYRGLSLIGGPRTALYQNLVPVVALAFAWFFLYERMSTIQILGSILVVTGLYSGRTLPEAG